MDATTKKYLKFTIIIYLLSNFSLLLNNGVFFDDWAIYNMPERIIFKRLTEASGTGSFLGVLHCTLLKFGDLAPLLYRVLILLFQILTIIVLFNILYLLRANKTFFLWCATIYAITPYFFAKNTMICFPYTLSLLFFLLGFCCWLLYYKSLKMYYRISSLLLFFVSFLTQSLVFFYIVPFVIVYVIRNKIDLLHTKVLFSKFLRNHIDFIVLPFLFAAYKYLFLQPSGGFADIYNKMSFAKFLWSPSLLLKTFYLSFLKLGSLLIENCFEHLFLTLIIVILILILFRIFNRTLAYKSNGSAISFLVSFSIGVSLFFIGAFPYVLVGKIPSFFGYDTRHQLLLAFGAATMLSSLLFLIINEKYRKYAFAFLITLFIISNNVLNFQFLKGWMKQESMIAQFKNDAIINSSNTILVNDSTTDLNAVKNEHHRFYELSGMLKKALNTQAKLGIESVRLAKFKEKKTVIEIDKEDYNLRDYDFCELMNVKTIYISRGSYDINSYFSLLKLVYNYYFNNVSFTRDIRMVITISAK